MYGTIGHYRIKPGMEAQFRQLFEEQERALGHIPGLVAVYGYRMDTNSVGVASTMTHGQKTIQTLFFLKWAVLYSFRLLHCPIFVELTHF